MKSTLILIATFLFSCQLIFAQESFKLDPKTSAYIDKAQMECIYKYTVNAPLKDSVNTTKLETYTTILQASATSSKFWDWHSFKQDSIIYHSSLSLSKDSIDKLCQQNLRIKYFFIPVIFKNYPKDKITVTDEITPNEYCYSGNKVESKWELADDTLSVCGYVCNKAICKVGGKVWTAWYTPEISISDGPWKLYGLPGLILKATDDMQTHTFEAITIRNTNRPIYMSKNLLQIKTTRETFLKMKNNFEKDPEKNLTMSEIKKVEVLKGNISMVLINGKRSSLKRETKYCPLELE